MKIDWTAKLQHLLQVIAFCLVVATLQVFFEPGKPYGPPVVYSLFIGLIIWAIIDLGALLIPSARETGWPRGASAPLLVASAIVIGWYLGNFAGDALCHALGLFRGPPPNPESDLRNSVLITIMAGIAGSYWFYARSRSDYLERRMDEAQRHANEARLKLLETQLEPHMLFNTLANLRALIGVDPARAQQMLDHMIAYLRSTLDASRAATHPLHAEFARLQDYLELMSIRMGPRLAYTLALAPEVADVPVPTLLLQPLVENSIQHGLELKVEGGRVDVRARREDDRLVIDVVDTGVGEAAALSTGKGFGLAQVRERLAALHGDEARLDFERSAQGAHARITLPIA